MSPNTDHILLHVYILCIISTIVKAALLPLSVESLISASCFIITVPLILLYHCRCCCRRHYPYNYHYPVVIIQMFHCHFLLPSCPPALARLVSITAKAACAWHAFTGDTSEDSSVKTGTSCSVRWRFVWHDFRDCFGEPWNIHKLPAKSLSLKDSTSCYDCHLEKLWGLPLSCTYMYIYIYMYVHTQIISCYVISC